MRLRRRVAFATPFVLVMGCHRKPAEEPKEPEEDDEEEVVAKSEPQPALIDTSHFPLTRDPPRREEPLPCSDPRARCTDNPPRPTPPPVPQPIDCNDTQVNPGSRYPTCNPPSPLRGRVINIKFSDGGTVIVIGRGSRDGVSKGWKGCVLVKDRDARCMQGGEFTVNDVTTRTSVANAKLTPDQIRASGTVKLEPP